MQVRPGCIAGGTNEAVSYQASMGQYARECNIDGSTLRMRVGVEGRLLLGPQGKPGTFTIPVRVVVKDGDKVAYSSVTRLSVTVPPGDTQADFSTVQEGISLPIGAQDPGDQYNVLVGFDPGGAKEPAKPKQQSRRRR